MGASPETVGDRQYVDFDEYIDIQLRKTGSTIKSTDVLTAVVGVLTLVIGYLLLFVIFDHWVVPGGFGAVTRGAMLACVGIAAFAWLGKKVILPWRRRVSGLYAARTIESAAPGLKSSLLNLVDLLVHEREIRPEVYNSIERRAALALTHVDVNEAVDRRSLLRLSVALLAVVVLFCLYWVLSPKNPATSLWRAIAPAAQQRVATRTQIEDVRPGDTEVIARTQLEVTADLRGEIPAQTSLYFSTADNKYVDERIEMRLVDEASKQVRCVINGENGAGILQSMTYRIVAGDAATREYRIHVVQPPSAAIESIRLEYPEYTGREPVNQTTGPIDALEGTRVTLKAAANIPVRSASLQFFDDESASKRAEEIPVRIVDGTKLQVDWKLELRQDGSYPHFYRIFCTSMSGDSDPRPSLYPLNIRADQPPEVVLRSPKTDLELPANAVLPLVIEARDPDYRLRYVNLKVEKDGSPIIEPELYEGHDQTFRTTYDWSLAKYRLSPKQTLTYWIEAQDNRRPLANTVNTPRLRIRIVDPVPPEQVQKDLQAAHQKVNEEAAKDEQQADNSSGDKASSDPRDKKSNDSAKAQKGQDPSKDPRQQPDADRNEKTEPNSEKGSDDKGNGNQGAGGKDAGEQGKTAGSKAGDASQQKLDPDNPADDAQAIKKIMERQKEDKNEPGNGANGSTESNKAESKKESAGQAGDQPEKGSESPPKNSNAKKSGANNGSDAEKSSPDQSGDAKKKQEAPSVERQSQHSEETSRTNEKRPDSAAPKADAKGSHAEKSDGGKSDGGKPDSKPEEGRSSSADKQPGDKKTAEKKPAEPEKTAGDNPPSQERQKDGANDSGVKSDQKNERTDNARRPQNAESSDRKTDPQSPNKEKIGAHSDESPRANDNKANDQKRQDADRRDQGKADEQPNDADRKNGASKADKNRQEQEQSSGNPTPSDHANDEKNPGRPSDSKPKSGAKGDAASEKDGERRKQDEQDAATPQNKRPDQPARKNVKESPADAKNGEQSSEKDREAAKRDGDSEKRHAPDKTRPDDSKGQESGVKKNDVPPGKQTPGDERQRPGDAKARPNDDANDRDRRKADGERPKTLDEKNRRPRPNEEKSDVPPSPDAPNNISKKDSAAGQDESQKQGSPRQGGQQKADSKQGDSSSKPGSPQDGQPKGGEQKADERKGQEKPGGAGQSGQPGKQGQNQGPEARTGKNGQPGKEGQNGSKGEQGESGKEAGNGQNGDAGSNNQSKQSGDGSSAAKEGGKNGAGQGSGKGAIGGGGHSNGGGNGAGTGLEDTTKNANLDYAKQAVNLTLNRLDHQLQRGKVDPKLLKELGWTEDQVRKFVQRMKDQVERSKNSTSAADEARRLQFEETIKSLGLQSPAKARSGSGMIKRQGTEIESRRSPPPAEYKELYEAFNRSIAR